MSTSAPPQAGFGPAGAGPSGPPQNLEAERSVLGAIMVSLEAMERVSDILKPAYFYRYEHGLIFEAAIELLRRSEPVDIITLAAQLTKAGVLEKVGGHEYLAGLEADAGIASNIEAHARRIEEAAVRRGLLDAGRRIHELGQDNSVDVDKALDSAGEVILRLATERTTQDAFSLGDAMSEYWDRIEKLHEDPGASPGIKTGFFRLDDLTGGLQPATLIIVAARPAVGKTSFALNVARNVAMEAKVGVAIFSFEMSKFELTQRFISSEASVDSLKLRTGHLSDKDWSAIANAMGALSSSTIMIDDRPGGTVIELRAKARRLKAQRDIGLVIIDYIQLMSGSGRTENRTQEVSEISRSLKRLAVELDIPVVALSQLSRAPEQRGDRRPQLADLRESGSLEQDADQVMMLYREGLHNDEVPKTKTELIIAKNRNGPTGDVELMFQESRTRFVNVTRQAPPSEG